MGELTLSGLRVALEVGRTGSFSAAAEQLGYTQSAVSRQVAVVETAAGSRLFERYARGVRPTAAGEVLLRHAAGVLEGVNAATQELAGLRERLAGRLTVGAFPIAAASLLPRAIARLQKTHPALRIQLTEASTPSQLRALRRGRLETAVIATGDGLPAYDLAGLTLTKLRSRRGTGVVVAASHPFARRDWVNPEDLAGQKWIVGASLGDSPEFGAWPGIDEPEIAFTVRNWQSRLGFVAAGLGIALMPGLAADTVPEGTRWIPVQHADSGLTRSMYAVTGPSPTPSATAMVRALRTELNSALST